MNKLGYAQVRTRLGSFLTVENSAGLLRVAFDCPDLGQVEQDLKRRLAGPVLLQKAAANEATRALEGYAAEGVADLRLPVVLTGLSPFHQRVLTALRAVPVGSVRTYGELAQVGSPGAAQAVGGAMGKNPVVIFLPCHRVIAAGGKLGGFTGGLERKRRLLRHEGVTSFG